MTLGTASEEAKAAAERAAFRTFVERMDEEDAWLSVESCRPPEPDLICKHASRGLVAFELVAITDPRIAKVNAGYGFGGDGHGSFITSDPSERIIRKKLKSTYLSQAPMELLVYNDQLVITPDDVVLSTILPWIGSLDHPFQRVWFMGEGTVGSIWHVT